MDTKAPQPNNQNWFLSHKFLSSLIGILILLVIAGSIIYWQIRTGISIQSGCVPTSKSGDCDRVNEVETTSTWKTYTNEEYGFQLEYPAEWEPLEQDNTLVGARVVILPLRYNDREFSSLYNVCFAPSYQKKPVELQCELEVYISKDVAKFAPGQNDFLGFPVPDAKMTIDGITATTYARGQTIQNVFIEQDNTVYLFTLPRTTAVKLERFEEIFVGPQGHRLDGGRCRAAPGDHDGGNPGVEQADAPEHLQAG